MAQVYYNGSEYCEKNTYFAKVYWISVYIKYPYHHNEKNLNLYFPGWKSDENEAYDALENESNTKLERLAKNGIAAAAYILGKNLYSSNWWCRRRNGFNESKSDERRWFLRAALSGYTPAYDKLREYYNIDATEADNAFEMFQCGVKYWEDKSEQGKDLTFYWFKKAVNAGYEEGCNNLGVCYNDGIGTECDYETANALYLRAIDYNGNNGGYRNYGVNLFYGNGVKQDKEKAKEYLITASDKGNEAAKKFLKDNYGITDALSINFDAIDDTVIFTKDVLYSAGSYYILNAEHNGIEIYFPFKPKEVIRNTLKAGNWRWFQSKGCWYTFNSSTNKELADRITGHNMRR
jgi:TPR repeat protein